MWPGQVNIRLLADDYYQSVCNFYRFKLFYSGGVMVKVLDYMQLRKTGSSCPKS